MSSYINNIIDLSNILKSFKCNENKTDSQVLDPFSCLVRLCLLNYKPIGTKLSFTNNKIVFQEPDFLQPARRWSSGDSRQHIHNLYNPIFKLNKWYNINTTQFIYLLNSSKSGLNQLLKCYNKNDSNLIAHSINYYIETIDKTMENTNNNDINNDINTELNETTDIYSIKLKDLWNLEEINIIYLLLLEIEKKNKLSNDQSKFNNTESLILCIEQILYGKDTILNNIVNKISTSL